MGIIIKRGDSTYHILNVYLPTESADNMPDFTHYLYKIHTLFQSNNTVYNMAIGDFNANLLKHSIFGSELMKFCNENGYILSDQNKLPRQTFTFHSDAHDSVSWLDHALCSMSMYQIIDQMSVLYQYLTSDHFPLSLCLRVPQPVVNVQASDDEYMGASLQKVDWGQLPVDIIVYPLRGTQLGTEIWRLTSWIGGW